MLIGCNLCWHISILKFIFVPHFPHFPVILYRWDWSFTTLESIYTFAFPFLLDFSCGMTSHIVLLDPNFSWVQLPSCVLTLCDPVDCSRPGVHQQLPDFTQTHVHWVGDAIHHLILSHPLLLPPSILPSITVFSNESVLPIRWPEYWSFSFSISASNKFLGLTSFRMDWLDLLAVQGTLKSLLQHHSSKASILWCSAFFIALLSHPYMTTGKTIALTRWTFVGKGMSLLFNKLFRFVIILLIKLIITYSL